MKNKTKNDDIVYEREGSVNKSSFKKSGKNKKDELKKVKEESKEYLLGWQRAQADLINLKKQFEEEKKYLLDMGREDILVKIIPALDSFELAFSNKEAWEKAPREWRSGVEYIHNQLENILVENKVEKYGKTGEVFDAHMHFSVGYDEGGVENEISKVIQSGYKKGDKILREAKVRVFSDNENK